MKATLQLYDVPTREVIRVRDFDPAVCRVPVAGESIFIYRLGSASGPEESTYFRVTSVEHHYEASIHGPHYRVICRGNTLPWSERPRL